MDDNITRPEPERWRRRGPRVLRWAVRLLPGPLVIAGVAFGLVYASAGTDAGTSLDGAQPIDYHEECDNEGCSSEEVKELWTTYREECFGEGCYMEEVAENAGTSVYQDQYGIWHYANSGSVARMMDYFVTRLGHWDATEVQVRPGLTNSFGDNLIRQILRRGVTVSISCQEQSGGTYNCT